MLPKAMIPTRRLWTLILVGVPVGSAAFAFGYPHLALAWNLLLLCLAIIDLKLVPSIEGLRLRRILDPVLSVRVPNQIRVEVENTGVEDIVARVRDEGPGRSVAAGNEFRIAIAPGRVEEHAYTIVPPERGTDYFRGTWIRQRGALGLIERQSKLNTEQPVRIYPNVLALKEFDLLRQKGRLRQLGIRKSRMRGLGMEFESLRDYSVGDDYRKIDWKASARRSKLVVRQFEQERNQAVIICIDIGRRMLSEVGGVTKLDHTLNSLLMLANAAANEHDLVGLLVYADTVRRYIPPRKGRVQIGAIIEAIHDLVAEPVETDFAAAFGYLGARYKRRSLLVNFTDLDDEEQAEGFLSAFAPISRRHLSLVARIADPSMAEMAGGLVANMNDLYFKAAGLLLTEDRKAAGMKLSTHDIHHLEAEPQNLAAELVSFYFHVKERSLI